MTEIATEMVDELEDFLNKGEEVAFAPLDSGRDDDEASEEEKKEEAPAQPGRKIETFVLSFEEKDGDQGQACAIECIAKMMFNLAFMLRHGTVVIASEESYIFRWTFDNHSELARRFTERLQEGAKQAYRELVRELEMEGAHRELRSINRAIVEYYKESLLITADDVAVKHEGRGYECAWYYCA